MKMDHSDMVRDADRIKKQLRHTINDMRRNNLEISVRFSWLDLMLAVVGTALAVMSFLWMMNLLKKMFSDKKCRNKDDCAEQ